MSEPGFFEILNTTRAMKRLKPDPVPLELLRKVLDAGTKAPSGVNTQPWESRSAERSPNRAGESPRTPYERC